MKHEDNPNECVLSSSDSRIIRAPSPARSATQMSRHAQHGYVIGLVGFGGRAKNGTRRTQQLTSRRKLSTHFSLRGRKRQDLRIADRRARVVSHLSQACWAVSRALGSIAVIDAMSGFRNRTFENG